VIIFRDQIQIHFISELVTMKVEQLEYGDVVATILGDRHTQAHFEEPSCWHICSDSNIFDVQLRVALDPFQFTACRDFLYSCILERVDIADLITFLANEVTLE